MVARVPPRPVPHRTVTLLRSPAVDGTAVIRVVVGVQATSYAVREIACEIGGRGFALHRLGLGPLYHVRIGTPTNSTCECLGYLRHGYCRHVLGLQALIAANRL